MTTNYGSPISGTLTGTTAIVNTIGIQIPASIMLKSADSGKAIQLSFDGTTYLAAVTPTYTPTGQIVYVLNFPVASVKFTGAAADTYKIL